MLLPLLTTSAWLCLQHSRNLGGASFQPSPVFQDVTTNCARLTKRFLSVSLTLPGSKTAGTVAAANVINHTVVGIVTPETLVAK